MNKQLEVAEAVPTGILPSAMYSRDEMKQDHPIAYRKAMQRAAEEHRKGMAVNLRVGNIKLMGR